MSQHDDEDRDRKIIIDSLVIQVAAATAEAAMRGELSHEEVSGLIECDERWLESVERVAPRLVAGVRR